MLSKNTLVTCTVHAASLFTRLCKRLGYPTYNYCSNNQGMPVQKDPGIPPKVCAFYVSICALLQAHSFFLAIHVDACTTSPLVQLRSSLSCKAAGSTQLQIHVGVGVLQSNIPLPGNLWRAHHSGHIQIQMVHSSVN